MAPGHAWRGLTSSGKLTASMASSTPPVFFCHGLESAPRGRKYDALTAAGVQVSAPDFRGMNLAARVDTLLPILADSPPALVIGSSYGGITALCAAILHARNGGGLAGLILCAPALGHTEPPADRLELRAPVPTTVLHGLQDDVVPITVSRDFAARDPQVDLIEVEDGHTLAHSLDLLVDLVKKQLSETSP